MTYKRIIAIAMFGAIVAGCTDPRAANKALDDMGFTDVQMTGYRIFTCGKDYTFHTGFSAKNARGKIITGAVCSSWLGGSAVKFD